RVAIASDFIEGELYADLLAQDAGKKLGLVERLRVLADVLSGLSSIHLAPELTSAGDKEGKPPMHGALDPHCVVVGADGSSRLVHLVRAPAISGKSRVEAPRYAAPELLLGDATAGVRADLYAVGVLLWEALTSRALFEVTGEKEVLARQLAGPLPLASVPDDAPWAKPLIEVTARALDVDPEKRHASAAELAGALRLAVQARLAPATRVSAAVASIAKEKIGARAAWKPAKKAAPAKSVKMTAAAPPKVEPKIETRTPSKPDVTTDTRSTKPDDRESTEKKPIPAIPIGKITTKGLGLPSLAAADDEDDETKRLAIDSIADDDLFADDEVVEVAPSPKTTTKKSMPPALPPKSVTPPPVEVVSAREPEAIATIAPVVTPAVAEMSSAPAAHAVPAVDSKIEVIPPLEDSLREKRRAIAIVIGVVAGAALLLLVGIIKHASKDDDASSKASATKATSSAQAPVPPTTAVEAETAAAAATTATADPNPSAFVAEPVATQGGAGNVSHPDHPGVQSSHPATPPAKPHKRPPHSSYEPEGI
ncbi:MAG: hypothetical protein ACREJX_04345, partial [Polyangiaceae bacterium]